MIVFAHAGGWDELAVTGLALVVGIAMLRWAERRARRRLDEKSREEGDGAG